MKKSKQQLSINKYQKRFNNFMIKLNKDINNDPNLTKETKKMNVFSGICIMMRKDINSFLRFARK
tara:strand:+ start:57 stop:251 length:195 start_codon:yes stop_codon:yes gene_type:complete